MRGLHPRDAGPAHFHGRRGGASAPEKLIQSGWLEAEKLVNLAKHNYSLEPNCQFTPDGKWIVFRSNLFGLPHVFMVEVAKAKPWLQET
jgi:oligogalacturonide lyase